MTAGLDSPRAVIFMGGQAVVSESGHGGPTCFAPEPGFNICYGDTSRISKVNSTSGARSTLASGFLSVALGPEGTEGVMGLALRDGHLLAQVGGTTRELPPGALTQQAGHLMSVNSTSGAFHPIASVGDFDFDYTKQFTEPTPGVYSPGTQEHDANPTGIVVIDDDVLVADSGANTITRVSESGRLSVVQHFPWRDTTPTNFPSDEVPTCLAQTDDDSLWLGTLAGHLYRIVGAAAYPVVPMAGGQPLLSHVTGCTADEDGNLYLVNMFGPGTFGDRSFPIGSVVKYNTESHRGSVLATAASNPLLFLPYDAAIGPDGNLYVTAGAMCDSAGHNPFGGGPNPCQIGSVVGGRLVKITLPESDED